MTDLHQILNPKSITERSKATLIMREFRPLDIDKYIDQYDALKKSHRELIKALSAMIDVLKEQGLIKSVPSIENVLTKAKKLER